MKLKILLKNTQSEKQLAYFFYAVTILFGLSLPTSISGIEASKYLLGVLGIICAVKHKQKPRLNYGVYLVLLFWGLIFASLLSAHVQGSYLKPLGGRIEHLISTFLLMTGVYLFPFKRKMIDLFLSSFLVGCVIAFIYTILSFDGGRSTGLLGGGPVKYSFVLAAFWCLILPVLPMLNISHFTVKTRMRNVFLLLLGAIILFLFFMAVWMNNSRTTILACLLILLPYGLTIQWNWKKAAVMCSSLILLSLILPESIRARFTEKIKIFETTAPLTDLQLNQSTIKFREKQSGKIYTFPEEVLRVENERKRSEQMETISFHEANSIQIPDRAGEFGAILDLSNEKRSLIYTIRTEKNEWVGPRLIHSKRKLSFEEMIDSVRNGKSILSFSLQFLDEYRPLMWETSFQIASVFPMLGIGPDNFKHATLNLKINPDAYYYFWKIDRFHFHAHNNFFTVAAENGVIAAIVLLIICVMLFIKGFRQVWGERRKHPGESIYSSYLSIWLMFLILVICGLADFTVFGAVGGQLFWFLVAVLTADSLSKSPNLSKK